MALILFFQVDEDKFEAVERVSLQQTSTVEIEQTVSKIWSVDDENTEAKKSAIEIELYGSECPDNVPDTSDNNEEENLKTPSPLVIVHSSQPTLESNPGLIETHTSVPEPSLEPNNVSEPVIVRPSPSEFRNMAATELAPIPELRLQSIKFAFPMPV